MMKEKIIDILCEYTFIEREDITSLRDDDLLTQIGLDSINIVYVIGELEAEFGIIFNDEELVLDNFESLSKIEKLIEGRIHFASGAED